MMKYFRWLSIGAAILLCICLASPSNTQAASHKRPVKTEKSISKKSSHKTSRDSRPAKKEAGKKSGKLARADKKKMSAAKSDGEREVWLKRARESDALNGIASWYGKDFHKKKTASGVNYDMYTFTAAHRTLPLGTVVKVTDQKNGKSVMVCVTDRGPFIRGRVIDVSYAAAKQLDLNKRGIGKVNLEVVSDEKGAPLKSDHAYFVRYASDNGKNKVGPFKAFSDASAMHEALMRAHPDAKVVLEKSH